jgi:hypothetical protein
MNTAPRISISRRFSAFFAAAFVTLTMLGSISTLATVEDNNALMADVSIADRA